ncbi:MAG: undecaprenyl-diphosphate phosphatase [Deltaproteobacteria bacterium]|nr:undecaprenyl-diphosphate phosphatase [Deltaproteobacteria bacterium]MBW2415095.1 undecaprenyl-diphosphate phosphatase [Deltaproteobacteria bacterium]
MTLLQALLLGVLQGVTEFLPISSSGHLALVQRLMPDISTPFLLFEVVVHLGTLCAIGLVLRARILALLVAARSFLPGSTAGDPVDRRWILLIAVASLPTAAIGLALRGPVEGALHRPALVGVALLVTAVILLLSERLGRRKRGPEDLGVVDALWIGVAQGLAVFPGISRSGATIAAGLWRDARGEVAVEFSLLVSIPAVAGATLLVALTADGRLQASDLAPLAVGFVSAFAAGVLALRALQWAVAKRKLLPFAGYCGLVGAGAIALG